VAERCSIPLEHVGHVFAAATATAMETDKQPSLEQQLQELDRLDLEWYEHLKYAQELRAYRDRERRRVRKLCGAQGHDFESELESDGHSCRRVYTCKKCGYWE
jgi:hypothetical protein